MLDATAESEMKTGRTKTIVGWFLAAALVGSLIAALVFGVVNGLRVRAMAEAALEQEDRAVCAKLEMGPGSSRYA